MMTVPVFNHEGQQTGELELAPAVFGVTPKPAVLHQIVLAHEANHRQPYAHTKTRGEVRGGGKKPWAQKHTGRARHGSSRSPIWVGGGITHGPRAERTYTQKVNVKVRRAALRMALSDRAAGKCVLVLEDFGLEASKTKNVAKMLAMVAAKSTTKARRPSVLLALPTDRRDAQRTFRNLPRVDGIDVRNLNAYDVLRHDLFVTTRAGIERATALFAPVASKKS